MFRSFRNNAGPGACSEILIFISMKRILFLVITLLLFAGCRKNIFDYRNKYLGDYKFTIQSSAYGPCGYSANNETYDGKIIAGTQDDQIIIYYLSNGSSATVAIDHDGKLTVGYGFGQCTRKNMLLNFRSGGLGCGIDFQITGKKKSVFK